MDRPLASHPITATTDIAEAQVVLSQELSDLRIRKARNPREFRLDMNGVQLGRTQLVYNEFRTDTLVEPDEVKEAMLLVIGEGTPATFTLDGDPILCDRDAAVLTPSRRVSIFRPKGSGAFILRADFAAVRQRVARLLDRRPARPIRFERRVDVGAGAGARARRVANSLARTFRENGDVLDHPVLRAGFDDLVLSLLLSLPSNYSRELEGHDDRPVAPALVRRAEEYLEAHAAEPVTIEGLVTRLGCSRAALFKTFRSYRDYSPMEFLNRCRLESARAQLSSSSPGASVSSVAHSCGFAHLGRFAAAYRKRFGESPSETLRGT